MKSGIMCLPVPENSRPAPAGVSLAERLKMSNEEIAKELLEVLMEKMWFREGLPGKGWAIEKICNALEAASQPRAQYSAQTDLPASVDNSFGCGCVPALGLVCAMHSSLTIRRL